MTPIDKYSQIDIIDWAEKHISLDYGKFKRENHPLIVDPLRAAQKNRAGYVGILGSVQHIKTLAAQIWHIFESHVNPSRAGIYDLTEQALKEFSADKFTPLVESTDEVMDFVPAQAYRKTKFYVSTNFASVRLLSANVEANRNSKTFERVSADESWAYKPNHLGQIRDRMTSYKWSWQMLLPTSGQTKGSELDDLWEQSTQKVLHVPCDCCGEYIPYVWRLPTKDGVTPPGGIRYAPSAEYKNEDGSINAMALKASVYYECQLCAGHMPYNPAKQHERNLKGKYIAQNPAGDPSVDFYHYNAIAHFDWGDLALEWKRAMIQKDRGSHEALENFIRKRLAQAWSEADYISADEMPKNKSEEYSLMEEWEKEREGFIFCTIDVQKDHYYYVIREWYLDGGYLYSRLLDRNKVMSAGQIADACDKWKVPQGGLMGSRVFADGNYSPVVVQRMAATYGWHVFRGDKARNFRHPDTIRRIYSDQQLIDVGEGTVKSGARYVGQFAFSQSDSMNRLHLIRTIRDHHGKCVWTYPQDAGTEYETQIDAWFKIAKETSSGIVYEWQNRNRDDHYFDCEKMQIVCAAMAGLIGEDQMPEEDKE